MNADDASLRGGIPSGVEPGPAGVRNSDEPPAKRREARRVRWGSGFLDPVNLCEVTHLAELGVAREDALCVLYRAGEDETVRIGNAVVRFEFGGLVDELVGHGKNCELGLCT